MWMSAMAATRSERSSGQPGGQGVALDAQAKGRLDAEGVSPGADEEGGRAEDRFEKMASAWPVGHGGGYFMAVPRPPASSGCDARLKAELKPCEVKRIAGPSALAA
jgi:hypothetical protein